MCEETEVHEALGTTNMTIAKLGARGAGHGLTARRVAWRRKGESMRTSAALLLPACLFFACADDSTKPLPEPGTLFAQDLEAIRAAQQVPALAAARITSSGTTDLAAVGVRKLGEATPVTILDRWHWGSLTKAMTATLLATYVRDGQLEWSTTLAAAFPDFADSMAAPFRAVTVEQLLEHRAGIQPFTEGDELLTLPTFAGSGREQRAAFTRFLLKRGPTGAVGAFDYSNAGYGVAAAIAERIGDASWQELMQARVFGPLEIDAHFGWPAKGGLPEPWGHIEADSGGVVPHDPDGEYQLPEAIVPAGDVNSSLPDYLKFLALHLKGLRGETGLLLPPAMIARMHQPNGEYAFGWLIQDVRGVPASLHDGSAGTFYAIALIQPSLDQAIVAVTNSANLPAQQALVYAVQRLLDGSSTLPRAESIPFPRRRVSLPDR